MAYFRSDIDIIVFLLSGMKMSESAGLFKKNSSVAQRWAEREMGNTKKIRPPLCRHINLLSRQLETKNVSFHFVDLLYRHTCIDLL